MAVTRWRPLEEYHPAVRLMVRYMWRQEPPLLPSGFADQVGLPRQLVSRWLQVQAPVDTLDRADQAGSGEASLPSLTPPLAVRLARAMGLSPHTFLLAAGLCTDEEALFAVEDVWDYVLQHVAATGPGATAGEAHGATDGLRHRLEAARDIDLGRQAGTTTSPTAAAADQRVAATDHAN
jgi:hypothetical protein